MVIPALTLRPWPFRGFLYVPFILLSGATVADSLSIGYRTILIDDCCRGVDLNDIENTRNNVVKNHGVIVQSNEVSVKTDDYFKFDLCQEHNQGCFWSLQLLHLYPTKVKSSLFASIYIFL